MRPGLYYCAPCNDQFTVIGFQTGPAATLTLQVPFGLVAPMLLAIQNQWNQVPLTDEPTKVAQPLKLQSVVPFQLSDGRKGLNFRVENFELPVLFSKEQLLDLQNKAEEVEALKIDKNGLLN